MAKVKLIDDNGTPVPVVSCPGCKSQHFLHPAEKPNHLGAKWKWNGDAERPTFYPSVMAKAGPWPAEFQDERKAHGLGDFDVCHAWIVDGKITFLRDSTHPLAGTTAELLDWPEGSAA